MKGSISQKRHQIEVDRREAIEKLTQKYYEEEYIPRIKELEEDCGEIGHEYLFSSENGFGGCLYVCKVCSHTKITEI